MLVGRYRLVGRGSNRKPHPTPPACWEPLYPAWAMHPLIGITTSPRSLPFPTGSFRAYTSLATYSAMVERAGGIPVLLVPTTDRIDGVLDRLDGVIMSGGGDIDPTRYGGSRHEAVYGTDPARDDFEIALARRVAARRTPTLCICRGMQVMNVAMGGTLIEHIAAESDAHLEHWVEVHGGARPEHTVVLTPGSGTARALGRSELEVNSIHHQAVRLVGDGLQVTGRAPDGIIEAMGPLDADWPMWAVQWHPEALGPDDLPSLALFSALIDAAR